MGKKFKLPTLLLLRRAYPMYIINGGIELAEGNVGGGRERERSISIQHALDYLGTRVVCNL